MLIIAHRGASASHAENTLPAFQAAASSGARALELDVHWLHETLLVIHDDTLERTTDGSGALYETPLADLRALDAGGGAQIPILEEVFTALPAQVLINVELKGRHTGIPVASLLANAPDGQQLPDQVLLSSFYHEELVKAWQQSPNIPLAALFARVQLPDTVCNAGSLAIAEHLIQQVHALPCLDQIVSINVWDALVDESLVNAIHQAGFKLAVYTVNDLQRMRVLDEIGIDAVFTDDPALAIRHGLDSGSLFS